MLDDFFREEKRENHKKTMPEGVIGYIEKRDCRAEVSGTAQKVIQQD